MSDSLPLPLPLDSPPRPPRMTMAIVGAFVACFLIGMVPDLGLFADGVLLPAFFWYGEWQRPLVSLLLHAGVFHFFANTFLLLFVGPAVERFYGRTRLLLVFVVSGLAAAAASCALAPSAAVVTSSGAVFGLVGLLVGLFVLHPSALPPPVQTRMITVLGLGVLADLGSALVEPRLNDLVSTALTGEASDVLSPSFLNNVVHVAGLVAGFLLAFIVQPRGEARTRPGLATVAALALAFSFAALLWGADLKARSTLPYQYLEANDEFAAGRVERAVAILGPALERAEPGSGSELIRPFAQNALAWFYVLTGKNVKEGIALSEESRRAKPTEPMFLDTLGYLYALEGRCREADDVMGRAAELSDGAFDKRRDEVSAACAAGRRPDPDLPVETKPPQPEETPPPGRGKGIRV